MLDPHDMIKEDDAGMDRLQMSFLEREQEWKQIVKALACNK